MATYQITSKRSGVKPPLIMLTNSAGREIGQGSAKRFCLCSAMTGLRREDLKAGPGMG